MNRLLEQRLQAHVNKLALDIGERNVYRPTALHAAADYIRTTWQQLGYEVHTQGYYAKGVWSENLEIEITGSTSPGEIILAGAHYDSVTGSPGADDNASGIAALLEIARLLSEANQLVRCGWLHSSTKSHLFSISAQWAAKSMRRRRAHATMIFA